MSTYVQVTGLQLTQGSKKIQLLFFEGFDTVGSGCVEGTLFRPYDVRSQLAHEFRIDGALRSIGEAVTTVV